MKQVIWGLGQDCRRHWKLMLEAQAACKAPQLETVLKAVSKTFPVLVAFECFQQSQVLCAFFVKTEG